eukprot:6441082-Pyramimonas_sp.AAC.1
MYPSRYLCRARLPAARQQLVLNVRRQTAEILPSQSRLFWHLVQMTWGPPGQRRGSAGSRDRTF